jgi:hypothetical protein
VDILWRSSSLHQEAEAEAEAGAEVGPSLSAPSLSLTWDGRFYQTLIGVFLFFFVMIFVFF